MNMQTWDFQTLRSNIFTKTKKFAKPFFLFIQYEAQVESFKQKNCQESRDTVPLRSDSALSYRVFIS